MKLKNNTIIITGGSSGIGLELTKRLCKTNTVLICGRSLEKLEHAKEKFPEIEIFQCDISKKSECNRLVLWLEEHYSRLNILINNAAITHHTNFKDDLMAVEHAELEIQTNLLAPIILSKKLIPILEKNKNAKLINVTTGLVYVPRAIPIAVTEVLFPAVDTPWHKGKAPKIAISVEAAVAEMIQGLEKGKREIRVGKVKMLRLISRIAPSFALKTINKLE